MDDKNKMIMRKQMKMNLKLLKLRRNQKNLLLLARKAKDLQKVLAEIVEERTTKGIESSSKGKEKKVDVPNSPLLFYSKKAEDQFYIKFCIREMIRAKIVDMNRYKFFKISLYFHALSWDKFVSLNVDFVYPRLVRLFFANAVIGRTIPEIFNFIKGKHIMLNEKYLNDFLKFKMNGPRTLLGNKLIIAIPLLSKSCQLSIMFRPKFVDAEGIPHYASLPLKPQFYITQ